MNFIGSLLAKHMSLNNEPCMIMSTHIDWNQFELNYDPFRVGLAKCRRSGYAVDDLSTEICAWNETNGINDNNGKWS